ncbi:hypothetical protein WJX73_010930 [Symbiochloris irregularis]|uniref:D-3-phosphoglycerate dehydrogenase n=1 Tax=Symbiochloris irregularis TaxID=706552 RepID=A0AAW1NTG2_9CHLO
MSSESKPWKILFCGEEFAGGFKLTKEACESKMPNVEVVRCRRQDLAAPIGSADVALPMMSKLDAGLLAKAKQLKLILQFGVGVEGIDIPAATERGIWVSNIPSQATGNALACAEMAIYLSLACLRQQHEMAASLQNQRLGVPLGETLFGKTVLVVGFGNIAKELVPRLKPFGVKLLAVRRSPWQGEHEAEALLDERGSWEDLPSFAARSQLMILTCSQNEQTRGMINSSLLAACRRGVYIVNVARGGLLDYDAVRQALDSGHLGGLGLDVQWSEPWDPHDPISSDARVILTPHVAGVTSYSYSNMAHVVAHEVARVMEGQPPTIQLNQVNQQLAAAVLRGGH